MFKNKVIILIICLLLLVVGFGLYLTVKHNQTTNNRYPSSGGGTPAQEGEMITQAYETDLADGKKLLQAHISIPELGLNGKFVNGVFENSSTSKDTFAVVYHKHGDHFTFYLPGEMLDVSKNKSPTTTYVVLFNSELTDVIASKKIVDPLSIKGYSLIDQSNLFDKESFPGGRFDIIYKEIPAEGAFEKNSTDSYRQTFKVVGNKLINSKQN